MANGDGLRMPVCAHARHTRQFGELTSCLDKELSVAAAGNPQPDASRREMRNLRVVQKMHHVMNSGLLNCCAVISAAPARRPAAGASGGPIRATRKSCTSRVTAI